MATVTAGYNWVSGETVTPAKLNSAAAPTVVVADGEVTDAKLAATLDLSSKTVTLPDDSVTNAKLSLAANDGEIKKAINADNASPIFACRAWVNFNGATADNLVGTYTRSGNTITVTATAHGLRAGNRADITFAAGTGGTPAATTFEVISASTNQFTVTDTASGTITGTPAATIKRRLIRAAGNVSSVGYSVAGGYIINFATELPSANYAVVGSGRYDNGGVDFNVPVVGLFRGSVTGTPVGVGPTDDFCHLAVVNPAAATTGIDCNLVSIAVFA
jgi:hypothetical protein